MMRALKDGLRDSLAHWPSALLLFSAVALPAYLVGYVFQRSFVGAFGRSAALETLSGGFSFTTIFDLINREGFQLTPVVALVSGFLLISLPLHSFLTAGTVSALREGRAWSSSAYLTGAVRHTGGFLLLALLTVAALLILGAVTIGGAGFLLLETEDPSHPGVMAILGLGLVVGTLLITLGDFARIHLAHDPERGVSGSLRVALQFLVRNTGTAAVLMLVLLAASFLPLLGVVLFEEVVPIAVDGWLAPLVLVQQVAVVLRSWVRVFAFAAQSSLVRSASGSLRPGEEPYAPSPILKQGI